MVKTKEIMNKHYLNGAQMKHLQSLGLDCSYASHKYELSSENLLEQMKYHIVTNDNDINPRVGDIPCFDLQDILDKLPKEIDKNHFIIILRPDGKYQISLREGIAACLIGTHIEDELIDAAYNMLVWCVENKQIKK